MRIVFVGSPPFAEAAFQALLARREPPIALVTAADKASGRGRRSARNPLAERARAAGLVVLQPQQAREPAFLDELAALRPDLGVVVSYGQILSRRFLDTPRCGCINLHASLLPRWRGASPVQAALLAGDRVTGVTLQRVVPALDAGPVLARRELAIGERETAPELAARLAEIGTQLLVRLLDEIGDGPLPAGEEQDPAAVTVCRRLRREDGRLDWTESAEQIDRRVRAMAGWPVAEARLPGGELVKILAGRALEPDAEAVSARPAAAPGTVLAAGPFLDVRCAVGAYRIQRLQRSGRRPLTAEAFLRGTRLQVGGRMEAFTEGGA